MKLSLCDPFSRAERTFTISSQQGMDNLSNVPNSLSSTTSQHTPEATIPRPVTQAPSIPANSKALPPPLAINKHLSLIKPKRIHPPNPTPIPAEGFQNP